MSDELPTRIGLCPDHAQEFYYPLMDHEGPQCPCCDLEMVIYERSSRPVARTPKLLSNAYGE